MPARGPREPERRSHSTRHTCWCLEDPGGRTGPAALEDFDRAGADLVLLDLTAKGRRLEISVEPLAPSPMVSPVFSRGRS